MSKVLYQGHGSYRFTFTPGGIVVYLDPYVGEGYDLPADIILVTHEHSDHNHVELPAKKPGCRIIRSRDALKNGVYGSFDILGLKIEAVPAQNRNHPVTECVGYLITAGGKKIYCAGDTSHTDYMDSTLSKAGIDLCFLPIDGVYNMGPAEAARCADMIGAKVTVPVHMIPGRLFDMKCAKKFTAKSAHIMQPGETAVI